MYSSWSSGAEPARAKCRLVLSYVGTLRRRSRHAPGADSTAAASEYSGADSLDEDVRIPRRPWGPANHRVRSPPSAGRPQAL